MTDKYKVWRSGLPAGDYPTLEAALADQGEEPDSIVQRSPTYWISDPWKPDGIEIELVRPLLSRLRPRS